MRNLAVISCYYNPCQYRTRRENYRHFVTRLEEQRVPLFVVELATGEASFEIPEAVVKLRTEEILWQKERLLAHALSKVPLEFDAIAWVDADIYFTNSIWKSETEALLSKIPVVQPFEECWWLDRHDEPESSRPGIAAAVYHRLGEPLDDFGKFHGGYAWAARRELLEKHGFADTHILGSGDMFMTCAMYGWWHHTWIDLFGERVRRVFLEWGLPFYQDVRGAVGFVEGKVIHFWHGERKERKYRERAAWQSELDFDPKRDLILDSNGLWTWRDKTHPLRERTRRYFEERREDG